MAGLASVCTLRLTIKRAHDLKDVQLVMQQDPYVHVVLSPWGDEASTKYISHGGTDVSFEGYDNVLEFPYPGHPLPGITPELQVYVMDKEHMRKDRAIGDGIIDLRKYLREKNVLHEIEVQLVDSKGQEAGVLECVLECALTGTVRMTVLEGINLRNVQRLTDQEPYVRASLIPSADGKTKKTEYKRGINPRWSQKNVLEFYFGGFQEGEIPRLVVECMDKEFTRSDRLIGRGTIDIRRILNFRGVVDPVTVNLDIKDDNGLESGTLVITIEFENEAYDENKEVLKLPDLNNVTFDTVRKVNSRMIKQEAEKVFLFTESQLDYLAPPFVRRTSRKLGVSKVFIMWMLIQFTFVFVAAILIGAGARAASSLIGVVYPLYRSYKALETPSKDDDTLMLTYWMVYGTFNVLENTFFKPLAFMNPTFFYIGKAMFLIWLVAFDGANLVYRLGISPLIRRNERQIDAAFYNIGAVATEFGRDVIDAAHAFERDQPEAAAFIKEGAAGGIDELPVDDGEVEDNDDVDQDEDREEDEEEEDDDEVADENDEKKRQ